jgi:digeranylgeranylglycerophospholipid reductase
MSVLDCDVLVVGAGPAGSVAALYCSRHGLKTVLIEKNTGIGQNASTRIDSSPDVGLTKIVKELDLKTENLVFTSKWYSPDGSSFTLHSKLGEYYFKRGPDPDSFECSTVNQAVKTGCMLLEGASIVAINRFNRGFEEVIIAQGKERTAIKPKLIIAADGEKSLFHQYVTKQFINQNRVAYGVTGTAFGQVGISEIYFDAELAPGGYFYHVTSPNGYSSAGIVINSNRMEHDLEHYFYAFVSKHSDILPCEIVSSSQKFTGERRLFTLDQHYHENMLVAGDAAGVIDPLMVYGMMPAIVTGYFAGLYSVEAIKKGHYQELGNYEQNLRTFVIRRRNYIYTRLFESFDNKDFDSIIKLANDLGKRTNVDDLINELSLRGLLQILTVLFGNLPSSCRLLARGLRALF